MQVYTWKNCIEMRESLMHLYQQGVAQNIDEIYKKKYYIVKIITQVSHYKVDHSNGVNCILHCKQSLQKL